MSRSMRRKRLRQKFPAEPGAAVYAGRFVPENSLRFMTSKDISPAPAKLPAGWRVIVQVRGYTPSTQNPSDSAKLQNLTFYYSGPDIPGRADLGNFSVGSGLGDSTSGLFSYQALKNGSGVPSGTGAIDVPVLKPKAIAACDTGKCAANPPPPSCSLTLAKSANVTSYSEAGTPITYSIRCQEHGQHTPRHCTRKKPAARLVKIR
jgi:hypothetical protein